MLATARLAGLLAAHGIHHAHRIQAELAKAAPTACWPTTYDIMATKTGPHEVSTILPIA